MCSQSQSDAFSQRRIPARFVVVVCRSECAIAAAKVAAKHDEIAAGKMKRWMKKTVADCWDKCIYDAQHWLAHSFPQCTPEITFWRLVEIRAKDLGFHLGALNALALKILLFPHRKSFLVLARLALGRAAAGLVYLMKLAVFSGKSFVTLKIMAWECFLTKIKLHHSHLSLWP